MDRHKEIYKKIAEKHNKSLSEVEDAFKSVFEFVESTMIENNTTKEDRPIGVQGLGVFYVAKNTRSRLARLKKLRQDKKALNNK